MRRAGINPGPQPGVRPETQPQVALRLFSINKGRIWNTKNSLVIR
jgi:hypothetical protein